MTEATATDLLQAAALYFPLDDPLIDFTISDWVAPSLFIPHNQANPTESQTAEQAYRNTASPTQWYRYLQLGRYTVTGQDFDVALEEYDIDPVKVHCIIWYNYTYHVDRMMECSPQLEAWATRFSQPYLNEHRGSALLVDTVRMNWLNYSKQQSLSENWSTVASKQQTKPTASKKSTPLPTQKGATQFGTRHNPISTIPEETSTEPISAGASASGKRPSQPHDEMSDTSDGKMSALLPNLNVPVCDGTYRVTIRWKLPLEVNRISRQTAEMKEAIYKFLNELFHDDDGYIYKWSDTGKETYNTISKMTSSEVRHFICPSITIIPSQSLAVIPLRFGFSKMTPTTWRNSEQTKRTLESHNATVSISNSTSTSGDLVISGYILLKAPTTTHRLRYLQSLRKKLPDTTPPFDILLHQRSPTDQSIPHLVVQCGERHAHALSEALMTILTGTQSAVFIPRSAFEQMTSDEAVTLFDTHDQYIKLLQWLPLFPLLSNLDRLRIEHYPDGKKVERTTREWARHITLKDGITPANCDVVNGGADQLSYLIFPPDSGEAAYDALEKYRTLINPFKQREERYRGKVGPVTEVRFTTKVIANLDFMRKLSTDMSQKSATTPTQGSPSQSSPSNNSTTSSVTEVSQISRPPTPAESLRQQWSARDQAAASAASMDRTDNSETSRSSSPSKLSSSRMSTSSAKFREIDVALQRQKKATEKTEQTSTDRFVQMERQLHRITDVETKLDSVNLNVSTRLTDFEGRILHSMKQQVDSSGEAMIHLTSKLEKLMSVVEVVLNNTNQSSLPTPFTQMAMVADVGYRDPSSSAKAPMTELTIPPQKTTQTKACKKLLAPSSPEKKRLRSTGKRRHQKESTRMELDSRQSQEQEYSSIHFPIPEHPSPTKATTLLNDITTDLERRYTAQKDAPPTSPDRGLSP